MAIKSFNLQNFGPLASIQGSNLGKINLIIGANSTGKTFLLKALYSVMRSLEECNRGDDRRTFDEVLSDKLYWTFQADKLGDLVTKGANNRLQCQVSMQDSSKVDFEFGQDTTKKIVVAESERHYRKDNSVFLPPKEVLSLSKVILKSGLQDRVFGFDATYVDLVLALQSPLQRGRNYDNFSNSRQKLEGMFSGRIEFDQSNDKWIYKQGNSKFSINTTAEGIKKIGIFDTLLGNRYLTPESVIFIDEPESALHPTAISQLLDIILALADNGIQFFIATHSYFVIKKLYILARGNKLSLPVFIANQDNQWQQADLFDGMPENEIINESIRLYEAELDTLAWG